MDISDKLKAQVPAGLYLAEHDAVAFSITKVIRLPRNSGGPGSYDWLRGTPGPTRQSYLILIGEWVCKPGTDGLIVAPVAVSAGPHLIGAVIGAVGLWQGYLWGISSHNNRSASGWFMDVFEDTMHSEDFEILRSNASNDWLLATR